MSNELFLALQITVIGMGLVFGSILLFWLVMAVLVRVTQESVVQDAEQAGQLRAEHERKRRAAVAAVAAALAHDTHREPNEFILPPASTVSPWQAVMRANQLRQRGRKR